MREPCPGLVWSKARLARRAAYGAWTASAGWQARREAWHATFVARFAAGPVCAVCGAEWSLGRGDLHHRSYDRLGHEADADLVPVCRACHTELHALIESSPPWRRLARPQASDLAIAHLRRRRQHRDQP